MNCCSQVLCNSMLKVLGGAMSAKYNQVSNLDTRPSLSEDLEFRISCQFLYDVQFLVSQDSANPSTQIAFSITHGEGSVW